MSNYHCVVRPLLLSRKKRSNNKQARVCIFTDQHSPQEVIEFIELVRLIYPGPLHISQRDGQRCWLTFLPNGMSPAGLRVAMRLWDIPVEVLAWEA